MRTLSKKLSKLTSSDLQGKKNTGYCLTPQQPEAAILVGANRRLTKEMQKEKLKNQMSIGSFEKILHIHENLEGHVHVQDHVYALKRP